MRKNEHKITVNQDTLNDLLAKNTNNPIADQEMSEILDRVSTVCYVVGLSWY